MSVMHATTMRWTSLLILCVELTIARLVNWQCVEPEPSTTILEHLEVTAGIQRRCELQAVDVCSKQAMQTRDIGKRTIQGSLENSRSNRTGGARGSGKHGCMVMKLLVHLSAADMHH